MGRFIRPAKFVLWFSSRKYYVSEKCKNTRLGEYEALSHFVSFHSTQANAYAAAIERQNNIVKWEIEHLKDLKKDLRKALKESE
jgi:hypothetical protein